MTDFFEGIPQAMANRLQDKYMAMMKLKEEREAIFRYFAVTSAEELKERIRLQEVADEAVANEACEAILEIESDIEALREECKEIMKKG